MDPALALATPLAAAGANVVLQTLAHRLHRSFGLMRSIMFGFGLGLFVVLILHYVNYSLYGGGPGDVIGLLVGNLLIYGCLGYLFFQFVNVGEASIRVRILRELAAVPGGMTLRELEARYNDELILETRLGRLLNNRQIIQHGDRFLVHSPVLRLLSGVMQTMKSLLLRRASEFE